MRSGRGEISSHDPRRNAYLLSGRPLPEACLGIRMWKVPGLRPKGERLRTLCAAGAIGGCGMNVRAAPLEQEQLEEQVQVLYCAAAQFEAARNVDILPLGHRSRR